MDNEHILRTAFELLKENGFKAMTMDSVAKKLRMSKRTLYELFQNKNDLILQALQFHHLEHSKQCRALFETSENVIEGLVKILRLHNESVKGINIEFFHDMDRLYPELRKDYDKRRQEMVKNMQITFQAGVKQGVFLENINYEVMTQILMLQMESIKRMERNFTKDLTLGEIIDTVMLCFVRSIASAKGLELLEAYISQYYPELKTRIDNQK